MTKYIFDIETCGLDSIRDRIICISLKNDFDNTIKTLIEQNEKDILVQFWDLIKENDILIGFNSNYFDFPFIIKRSVINNVPIPFSLSKLKLIDLREIANSYKLSKNIYDKGTLHDWSNILGFAYTTQNGDRMPILFNEGNFQEITKHNQEDIVITELLFKRIERCMRWEDITST